ncbi:hypothetical protein HNR16_001987 [Pseudoclavibacter chungangensis]|nr:hypothetical protein [Pseudoclavibacter chungangensis]
MTSAIAAVAAVIIAGRPPRNAIEIAITIEENKPTSAGTPAAIANAMASGMSARPTTIPARTSFVNSFGERNTSITVGRGQ